MDQKCWCLFVVFVCALMAGCGSQTETQPKPLPKVPPAEGTQYKNGAKLVVNYVETSDKTGIYQQAVKTDPVLFVDGKPTKEKHWFESWSNAEYKGRVAGPAVGGYAFILVHVGPGPGKGWSFPPKARFAFVADGERVELPVPVRQSKYELSKIYKDPTGRPAFSEQLIIGSNFEMYSKIAKAKDVEFQIGSASFKLTDENKAAFGDFASYFTSQ